MVVCVSAQAHVSAWSVHVCCMKRVWCEQMCSCVFMRGEEEEGTSVWVGVTYTLHIVSLVVSERGFVLQGCLSL